MAEHTSTQAHCSAVVGASFEEQHESLVFHHVAYD